MNSSDPWTNLLASWTPRRPSPGLEARIFGTPATPTRPTPAYGPSALARWLGWGVPSLGAAFLYASLWIHPMPSTSTNQGLQSAQLAALRSAAAQSAQNTLPWVSFSWTNSAQPLTTNSSVESLN